MKALILIILSFGMSANANWFPLEKTGAKTVYMNQAKCEQAEGQACFDITTKDPRLHSVQTVQVRDPGSTAPVTVPKIESCIDQAACEALIADPTFCEVGEESFWGDRIGNEELQAWCVNDQRPFIDFKTLVSDPVKVLAKQEAAAQKQADDDAREVARGPRELDLDQCVADSKSATLTLPQASDCIRALVREQQGEKVQIDDL